MQTDSCLQTNPTPETRLREEDLVPGKPWVHPDTFLEYADFHAFFKGEGPLSSYANFKVAEATKHHRDLQRDGYADPRYIDPFEGTGNLGLAEYLPRLAAFYGTFVPGANQ